LKKHVDANHFLIFKKNKKEINYWKKTNKNRLRLMQYLSLCHQKSFQKNWGATIFFYYKT
jgi:hypothetical protein